MTNILSGKKKIGAFLVTMATVLINTFIADPAAAESISALVAQYLPALMALLCGGGYLAVEGTLDVKREDVKEEQEKTKQVEIVRETEAAKAVNGNESIPIYDLPDFDLLDKRTEAKAKTVYFEDNPCTRLYAARSVGDAIQCTHIDQVLLYWDWLQKKAESAFSWLFGFPYAEAEAHLADNKSCPYYSVENMARQTSIHHWRMLLDLRETYRKIKELETVAELNLDWRRLPTHTLFNVGDSAHLLLGNAQGGG